MGDLTATPSLPSVPFSDLPFFFRSPRAGPRLDTRTATKGATLRGRRGRQTSTAGRGLLGSHKSWSLISGEGRTSSMVLNLCPRPRWVEAALAALLPTGATPRPACREQHCSAQDPPRPAPISPLGSRPLLSLEPPKHLSTCTCAAPPLSVESYCRVPGRIPFWTSKLDSII